MCSAGCALLAPGRRHVVQDRLLLRPIRPNSVKTNTWHDSLPDAERRVPLDSVDASFPPAPRLHTGARSTPATPRPLGWVSGQRGEGGGGWCGWYERRSEGGITPPSRSFTMSMQQLAQAVCRADSTGEGLGHLMYLPDQVRARGLPHGPLSSRQMSLLYFSQTGPWRTS